MNNENLNQTNNEDIFFEIVDTDGMVKKAEVLTLFTLEGSEKRYAICSIPTPDGNYDITAFAVNDIDPNTVSFDDITDQNELNNVNEAVKSIMSR